jgi:hypothetical protein
LDQSQLSERKDGGRHVTYGDLPGADPLSEPAGELKGRKFYVHQPAARTDRTCYEASEVDLEFLDADAKAKSKLVDTLHELGLSRIQPTDGALTLAQQIICGDQLESLRRRVGDRRRPLPEGVKRFVERLEGFHGDQSTLARFVSKPLTQFRFTLRFRDLRPWELGALLAVLNPGRLQNLPEHLAPELKRYFQELPQEDSADAPRFALKLGHGRPLGLGSVHIAVDQALVWQGQSQDAQLVPMASSQEQDVSRVWSTQLQRLDTATLKQWLEAHRYQGRDRSEYPSTNGKIYEYHTEERRQHAKGRRGFPTP